MANDGHPDGDASAADDLRPRSRTAAEIVVLAEAALAEARARHEQGLLGTTFERLPKRERPPRVPRPRTVPAPAPEPVAAMAVESPADAPQPNPPPVPRRGRLVPTVVKLVLTVALLILVLAGIPIAAALLAAD
jgi:hypothetical protein